MKSFPDLDVSDWVPLDWEQRGGGRNLWLVDPDQRRWLFKPIASHTDRGQLVRTGEDWSEKLAGEIAAILEVPAAHVELARHHGEPGIVSADVTGGAHLVMGNEVLHGRNPEYPRSKGGKVPGYNYAAIVDALTARRVSPPTSDPAALDAVGVFAGYLVLDALIGNQDRHHENWALLSAGDEDRLAPSFDHASSLGFQLTDAERQERCETDDSQRTPEAWARRAKCRPMEDRPGLVALALGALRTLPAEVADHYRGNLAALSEETVGDLVDRVPPARMSHPSRIFVRRVVAENRKRLLDGINRDH